MQPNSHNLITSDKASDYLSIRITKQQLLHALHHNQEELVLPYENPFLHSDSYQKYAEDQYSKKLIEDIKYFTATQHHSHDVYNTQLKKLLPWRNRLCVKCLEKECLEDVVRYQPTTEDRERNLAIQKFEKIYTCHMCQKKVAEVIWA